MRVAPADQGVRLLVDDDFPKVSVWRHERDHFFFFELGSNSQKRNRYSHEPV
jgi:hypothetical protein